MSHRFPRISTDWEKAQISITQIRFCNRLICVIRVHLWPIAVFQGELVC